MAEVQVLATFLQQRSLQQQPLQQQPLQQQPLQQQPVQLLQLQPQQQQEQPDQQKESILAEGINQDHHLIVPKKDGGFWFVIYFVIYFRGINAVTVADSMPLPRIEVLFASIYVYQNLPF